MIVSGHVPPCPKHADGHHDWVSYVERQINTAVLRRGIECRSCGYRADEITPGRQMGRSNG